MATVILRPSGILELQGDPYGPTTALSDDSDLTYIEASDTYLPGFGTPASVGFIPTFDPVPAMIGGIVTGVSVLTRVSGEAAGVIYMTVQDTYWPTIDFFHPTPPPDDFAWTASEVNNSNALAAAIGFGYWFPDFIAIANADLALRVYEVTATVDYIPARPVAPPRLLYPRTDDLGIGVGRIYPPPTTQQYGRRFGSGAPI